MKETLDILSGFKNRGIVLSLDDSGRNVKARGNVKNLSTEDKVLLKERKDDIVLLLKQTRHAAVSIEPLSKRASYALSSSQRRLWLLSQFEEAAAVYNIPLSFMLEGEVNEELFSHAFYRLISRHESLRTIFTEDNDGEPYQVILEPEHSGFALSRVDLRNSSNAESELKELIARQNAQPFDLRTGPLMRAVLVRMENKKWVLHCVLHHIISDGWSMRILVQELFRHYDARSRGEENPLPPLRVQYKDYAAWQQEQLSSERFNEDRTYWLQQFEGGLPVLELPADRTRPRIKTYNGALVERQLDADLSGSLAALTQQQGGTLFMGLLAAVKALFYHYSGQTDIITGTPIAGRENAGLEGQIGCFLNTLALRTRFNPEASFLQLLEQVKEITLGAFAHQSYPFEELVEHLDIHRDRSRNPLFDILVVLQNTGLHTAGQRQEAGGLKVSVHKGADVRVSKFDLTIAFVEALEGLQISIEYNTDIYNKATIERMAAHLECLMSAAVAKPETAVGQLDYLSEEEKHQLLVNFNDTTAGYPKDKTLVQLLEEQAARTPEATAVLFEDKELSYKELNVQANQLAHYLTGNYGCQPEDIIAVKLERSEKLVVALVAVLKSGAAYVPIDPAYPQERIGYMISDSGCKLVIDEELMNGFLQKADEYGSENLTSSRVTPNHLAYTIYTSGSTGQPKGVMIEHSNVVAFLSWCSEEFRHSDFDTVFATTSVCFDLSIFEIFYTLTAGKKLRVLPNGLAIPQYLHTSDKILANTVPGVVGTLLGEGTDFSNITVLNMAGEPIPTSYIRQLDCERIEVRNLYGPSEDTTYSTVYRIKGDGPVLVGRPISNTQVYITGSGGQLVPAGVTGEICISGAGLARGYLNKPGLTAEKFVTQTFNGKKERIYKTGDFGRWTADGNIEFLGRKDNQVKVRGYRIELGEIENALQSIEGIEAAVAVAKTTAAGEKELVAYLAGSEALEVQELRSLLGKSLPAYMIPTHFVRLEELPLTPNGKVDRKRLPEPEGLTISSAIEYTAPRNRPEEKLAAIWQDILQKEKIGIKDDFFNLGGHSLKATRLVSRIHREFEIKVQLKDLFSCTTIGQQAELVAQLGKTSFTFIAPVKEQPDYAASSPQYSLWMLSQFDEGSIAYNIPSAYVFEGALDQDALSWSMHALLERHESLRTVFRQDSNGGLRQVVRPVAESGFKLLFHDLRGQQERKQTVKELVHQEFVRPFDLMNGPLLRSSLYQVEDNQWVFSYVLHHIVSDGWSMEILIKELLLLYNARLHGAENPLKPLQLQYKDYAAWQQEQLNGDLESLHRSYWLKQFEGELPMLHLPADRPRPLVKTYNGGMILRDIPSATTDSLRALGERQGATLFMALVAAINTLLYRYTNQQDIIIGSPIAGRPHVDLEDQIGCYVNMLALRSRFTGEQSYQELLEQVRQLTLDAYGHQAFPFDELANALGLQRDASRHPLFDVTVTLQNMAQLTAQHSLPGTISATPYNASEHVTSKFDLNFNFVEQDAELRLRVEYNSDLFDRSTAERIAAHLEQLLQVVITAPATPLNQIDFLARSEKRQLLHDFNDTAVTWPSNKTITDIFEEQVERTPDAAALVFASKTFTYRQLNEVSNQLAHYLKTYYTITPDDLVAIQLDRSEWMMIAILAVLKSGAAYMPIDSDYPSRRVEHMMEDSGSKVLIESMLIDHFCMEQDQYGTENSSAPGLLPSHLAYVMYTSGSTGKPKGVLVEHRSVVRLVCPCSFAPLSGNEVLLGTGAFSFDATTFEYWSMLLHGGTLVLCPKETLLDSQKLRQEIESRKVDMMWFTAGWLHQLVDENIEVFEGLKTVLAGGDKLSVTHINRLQQRYPNLRIINGYGPTENTTFSLTYEIPAGAETIPIGKPISNSTAYVLDAQGQLCPVGVAGELCVGGAGLARGYLNNPELTGEKFISHPFIQGEKLYRTGDLARWLPDGNVEFLGRKDDQVKIRGYRIEIGEIEEVLQSYPGMDAAVVQARSVNGGEKLLVAYMVGSEVFRREDLRSYLNKRLPSYMIPSHYVQLEALPLNANGKVDRDALPDPQGLELNAGVEYVAPRNRTEEKLAQIWKEILGRDNISVKDNFFDLGGHSLKVTRLVSQVHKEFDVKIELKDFFEITVLEEQAQLIGQSAQTSFVTIEAAEQQDDYPLSSSQRRLWILSQLGEANAAYNMPAVFLFEGTLNRKALEASFASLIKRHESLRTVFRENKNGEVRQLIQAPEASGFVLNYFDLRHDTQHEELARDLVQKDFIKPFDLSSGPLLRASLYQVEDGKWVFSYVMHHIISDGWSMQILVRELLQFYKAHALGSEAALAPLRIQHRHYTAWQQERLQGEAISTQRDYWLKQFEGMLPVLDLPADKPRPLQRTFVGGLVTRTISPDLVQKLKALCQEQGGTLFMGLLATANALLHHYTGQNDIVIGSPIAGRDHADLENQIGFYLNTLPLRTRFSGSSSYRQLLDQTRAITLDAYQNQAFPFDELVDALDLRPEPGRNILFDVALVLQNTQLGGAAEELDDLRIQPCEWQTSRTAKFDLSFSFVETGEGLEMNLEYNSDIFEAATAERLVGHFHQLVRAAVEQPSLPIGQLDYLTQPEKDLLFGKFNDTFVDYRKDQTIISLFGEQVAKGANNIALSWNGGTLSYGELNKKADLLAYHLRKEMGVEHGAFVGIMLQRSELMVISILAVLKSGAAYVPIDPNLPADRKEYILRDTGIKTLIVQTDSEASGIGSFKGNILATDIQQLENLEKEQGWNGSGNLAPLNLQPSNLAYVIYTSGSTGRPKGVLLQHGGVVNLALWQRAQFNVSAGSRILQQFSYSFDGAVGETVMALLNGGTLCMYPGSPLAEDLAAFLDEQTISIGVFVPSQLRQIDPDGIRHIKDMTVVSVGEACPVDLAAQWAPKCRFMNAYGPTEYSVYSHLEEVHPQALEGSHNVPVGKPLFNTHTFILDGARRPAGIGVQGEIYLSGDGMARGYLDNNTATLARFVPNPFFLADKFRDMGWTELPGSREDIEDLERRGHILTHLPDIKQENCMKDLLELADKLEPSLRKQALIEIDKNRNNNAKLNCLHRYFLEAYYNSYASQGINEPVLRMLFGFDDFTGKEGVELGFGNAEVLSVLSEMGASVRGIELSPFFVQKARNKGLDVCLGEVDLPYNEFLETCGLQDASLDFSICTLLLDRVEHPRHLVKNLLGVLKEDGRFALQTLLPVIPVDDGDVEEKIIYTSEANRLTPGTETGEDKMVLIQVLYDLGAEDMSVYQLPYAVVSRDGVQEYTVWSFTGRRRAVEKRAESYSRMYRTGDLGKYLPNGSIAFLGRIDHQIKLRGYRIELGEIESVLQSHPAVDAAAVVTRTSKGDTELVAYVTSAQNLNIPQVRAYLSDLLPHYMRPARLVQVDEMPLTSGGKVDRTRLPEPGEDTGAGTEYVAPRNSTEEMLAAAWKEILGREKISVKDNFFELGGHSLRATRLASQIRKHLHVQVPLAELFARPVLEDMAQWIRQASRSEDGRILPVAEQPSYPLSSAQRRLWVLSRFEEANAAYNMPGVYIFEGELDTDAFQTAFQLLTDRHEALRTVFRRDEEGSVRQFIRSTRASGFTLEQRDFRNSADREQRIKELVAEEISKPFDLSSGPLLRAGLYRAEHNRWVFVYVMHHIISDGWSMSILVSELLTLYNAYAKGEKYPLPQLDIQYKDYASWQQEQLKGGAFNMHRQYWLGQCAELPPVLELPAAKPRPAVKTYNGNTLHWTLPGEIAKGLRVLNQEQGATLFMGLMAVVNTLLHRYSNQEDIVLGTPIAGRDRHELEDQIGFYLNTLPLRTRFSGNVSYRELLAQVKKVTLDAYEHQSYPFDELVDALPLQRSMSRSPLFDVMVVLQNNEQSATMTADRLSISAYPDSEVPVSKFDLVFNFVELGDDLHASIEYNTDLYEQATAERMGAHLQQLAAAIIEHPTKPIAQLDYLGEEEKRQLLVTFNDIPQLQPRSLLVKDMFEEQAEKKPGAPAVVAGGSGLSYEELNDKVNRLAHYLRNDFGIKPGDLVGIKVDRTEWMVISILGVLKSGAAYVPIDPEYPQERVDYMIADSNCSVLVDEEWLNTFREQMHRHSNGNPEAVNSPSDIAYVIYTSGSTGNPKGVAVPHSNLAHFFACTEDLYKGVENIVQPFLASHSFDISIFQLFAPLFLGGVVIVMTKEEMQDLNNLVGVMKECTVIDSVPSLLQMALSHMEKHGLTGEFGHVKEIFVGGELVSDALLRQLGKTFPNSNITISYGPTEATIFCLQQLYRPGSIGAETRGSIIGPPINGVKAYILNDAGLPVPVGMTGEICIGGFGVAQGYLNREKLTAEKFVLTDPVIAHFNNGVRERIYRSGDLGRWLPDGTVEFMGRKDDQVKVRGFRVELGEIENAICNHPAVEAVAVNAVTGKQGEKELVAYLTGSVALNATDIRAYLKNILPAHMIPEHFVQLGSLPLTPNGKLDKKKLPAPEGLAMVTGNAYMAPRNSVEEKLVPIWEEALRRDKIGVKDNFFDLGGNSLKIIRMVESVNKAFGRNLSVVMGFKYPNIAELAEFLLLEEQHGESGGSDADMDTDVNTVDETLQILNQE
jgi:amino acid adenylation domain-containing protein